MWDWRLGLEGDQEEYLREIEGSGQPVAGILGLVVLVVASWPWWCLVQLAGLSVALVPWRPVGDEGLLCQVLY